MSLINFSASESYASLFSTSTTKSDNGSRESIYSISSMKNDFREDIRKQRTRQILNAKRIKEFHPIIATQENLAVKSEECVKQFVQIIAQSQCSNQSIEQLELIKQSTKLMKELSHESICQFRFIESGIIPNLCYLLEFESLQADVCWILSNLICHESFSLECGIASKLIQTLVLLVSANRIDSIGAAFWCLSNLASDSKYAGIILKSGVCSVMSGLLRMESVNKDIANQMSHTIKNIASECCEETSQSQIVEMVEAMQILFQIHDDSIKLNLIESATNIMRVISSADCDSTTNIAEFSSKIIPNILLIINSNNAFFYESLLEFAQQLFITSQFESQVKSEFLNELSQLLKSCFSLKDSHIRRKAYVFTASVYPTMKSLTASSLSLFTIDFYAQLTSDPSIEIKTIILQGILQTLISNNLQHYQEQLVTTSLIVNLAQVLTEERNELILLISLDILRSILYFNRTLCNSTKGTTNPAGNAINESIEAVGLLNSIQNLQDHPSDRVYESIHAIIEGFFDFEEQDDCDIEDDYY